MIITLFESSTPDQENALQESLRGLGWSSSLVTTQTGRYLVGIGSAEFDIRAIGSMPGVRDIHRVTDSFKLVSRQWKVRPTVVDLGDGVTIGGSGHLMMAGPCSIEDENQVRKTVEYLSSIGIRVMRGGVFKPRSSPYSFRGLGLDGLRMFSDIARGAGIRIITEVLDASQIAPMYDFVDIFQVGARNSQNFTLLDELGSVDKPVLLKRGMSGSLEELLQSAEYIFSKGNEKILLCERGIRTYEKAYRNTLDLNAIPYLKEKSHLPVIVDPSHGIGVRRFVSAMTLAGIAAGADGSLVEIHERPEHAKSDAAQTLSFQEMSILMRKVDETVRLRERLDHLE